MKKTISMIICIILFSFASIANADYPTYLNGDRNLIFCDGHMGTAWYVDRRTLVVQKYEPPQYIIAINLVTAQSAYGNVVNFYDNGKGKITNVQTIRFFYNWDLREMYVDRTGTDEWKYLLPHGSWAETGIFQPAGETAFYLAYKMKFYGSKSFYDTFLKKSHPVYLYSDSFYEKI